MVLATHKSVAHISRTAFYALLLNGDTLSHSYINTLIFVKIQIIFESGIYVYNF